MATELVLQIIVSEVAPILDTYVDQDSDYAE